MNFKSIGTIKTSDAEVTKFMTVPQIRMSDMPQVIVGVIGHAMQLIGDHTHFCAIQEYCTCNRQIALGFASCNYLSVTGTINLKLDSNVLYF